MEFRIISDGEWEKMRPVFEAQGDPLPDPKFSTAAIADDGNLAGLWLVKSVIHAGPLWVREDLRGQGIWRGLHEQVERLMPHSPGTGYYTFSGSEKVEAIHRKLGFTELPLKVWERRY